MGILRKIQVRTKYINYALKNINKPKLGSTVYYNGVECSLIQGVSNPYWKLMPLTKENLDKPKRDVHKRVHVSEFEMQPLYKRFRFSFMTTYKFLMGYWYSIDISQKGYGYIK